VTNRDFPATLSAAGCVQTNPRAFQEAFTNEEEEEGVAVTFTRSIQPTNQPDQTAFNKNRRCVEVITKKKQKKEKKQPISFYVPGCIQ